MLQRMPVRNGPLVIEPETVARLVDLARALPLRTDTGAIAGADLPQVSGDDGDYASFAALIDGFDQSRREEILALVLVGRGDFEPREWPLALSTARQDDEPDLARLLAATPMLSDLIEEAYEALGFCCDG